MPKPEQLAYLHQRLAELGLSSPDDATFMVRPACNTNAPAVAQHYFSYDRHGNLVINYPNLEQGQYEYEGRKGLKSYQRTRYKIPKADRKYQTPRGAGIYPFWPPWALASFSRAEKVSTLILTEGELKAYAGGLHGAPVIGIGGIWNWLQGKGHKTLHPEILRFVETCQVDNIALLYDSDLFDLSTDPQKPASDRPTQFWASARAWKYATDAAHLTASIAWHQPVKGKKLGLDDLLHASKDKAAVATELLQIVEAPDANATGQHFTKLRTTGQHERVLRELWGLNGPEAFFERYKDDLSQREYWRYYSRVFENTSDGPKEYGATGSRLKIQDNCLYTEKEVKGDIVAKKITNFVLEQKFILEAIDGETYRIVEFKNDSGDVQQRIINSDFFASKPAFKRAIEKMGHYLFFGQEGDLDNIKDVVFRDGLRVKQSSFLGLVKPGQYLWANGLLIDEGFREANSLGVVRYGDSAYFLPAASTLYADDEAHAEERNFSYHDTNITLPQWLDLMHRVYGNNGIIAASFAIMSVFRDLLFKHTRRIPILGAFGTPGTGKTTLIQSISALWGRHHQGHNISGASTAKSAQRKLSQYRNAVVHFDEYTNDISNMMMGILKGAYDGYGYSRANKTMDNTTNTTVVRSCLAVSGQYYPARDSALLQRMILLQFHKTNFDDHKPFEQLKNIEQAGISGLMHTLLRERSLHADDLPHYFEQSKRLIAENAHWEGHRPSDRMVENLACVLTPIQCMLFDGEEQLPPVYGTLPQLLIQNAREQILLERANDEVAQFWEVIDVLMQNGSERYGLVANVHYEFDWTHHLLYVRPASTYDMYAQHMLRSRRLPPMRKNDLKNYLQHSLAWVEGKTHHNFGVTRTTAWVFDIAQLKDYLTYADSGNTSPKPNQNSTFDTPF